MTTSTPSSPNAWTITADSGVTLGTVVLIGGGLFQVINAAGKPVGSFSTMTAAIAALGG